MMGSGRWRSPRGSLAGSGRPRLATRTGSGRPPSPCPKLLMRRCWRGCRSGRCRRCACAGCAS
eukprot:8127377-Heterocapsa_arctica.AAC.1